VTCDADAAWLAAPERYSVARKCDGVRALLLVSTEGKAHIINRAGNVYEYTLRYVREFFPKLTHHKQIAIRNKVCPKERKKVDLPTFFFAAFIAKVIWFCRHFHYVLNF
jgi:hypothetical protein